MKPNLFSFATSELSQDAVLCWLLAWAPDVLAVEDPDVQRVGNELLRLFFERGAVRPPERIESVRVAKQEAGIDLLCVVNDSAVLVVEDKVNSQEHSNQLARYRSYAEAEYAGLPVACVYVQTGMQSSYAGVKEAGYGVVTRRDLIATLESGVGARAAERSDIVRDFARHLRAYEDDVSSFAWRLLSEWSTLAWYGFFEQLQPSFAGTNWGWVNNQSQGFAAFFWPWVLDENANCYPYLQLEFDRLCFKIGVEELEREEWGAARYAWFERVIAAAERVGLSVVKPPRFGMGATMTVAVFDGDYRVVDEAGRVDMAGTVRVLQTAEAVLAAARQPPLSVE